MYYNGTKAVLFSLSLIRPLARHGFVEPSSAVAFEDFPAA